MYHVDKDKFPERVKMIEHYLKNPGPRGNAIKDKTVVIGKKPELVLAWLSIEMVFWIVFAGLGLLGFWAC